METLKLQLQELENEEEIDTLTRYKKAIQKMQECLIEDDSLSIPQKNEMLKSIIERITYSKTKRLNWRKSCDDDMEICMELKI